jgi:lysophospholipase L1-like esterase
MSMPQKKRSGSHGRIPLKKVVGGLIYFPASVIFLLEIATRWWGCAAPHVYDSVYYHDPAHPDIPYLMKPGLDGVRGRGKTLLFTDAQSCRSDRAGEKLPAKQPGEFRIAFYGDSVTYGEGVRENKNTYCRVLEQELSSKDSALRVRVINYAVSGYNVRVMNALYQARAAQSGADLAIMALIGDDMKLARTVGLDKWGQHAMIDPNRPGWENTYLKHLLRQSHFAWLARDTLMIMKHGAQDLRGYDALSLYPDVYPEIPRFITLAREQGQDACIVLLPDVGTYIPLKQKLAADGVPFIDMTGIYQEMTPHEFHTSRWDPHPSAKVHRILGHRLAEAIFPLIRHSPSPQQHHT